MLADDVARSCEAHELPPNSSFPVPISCMSICASRLPWQHTSSPVHNQTSYDPTVMLKTNQPGETRFGDLTYSTCARVRTHLLREFQLVHQCLFGIWTEILRIVCPW